MRKLKAGEDTREKMKLINKEFFSKNSTHVARKLLGKIIEHNGKKWRIVETEAYGKDKASHGAKRTKRSELMRDSYGKIYVYLVYGMHYCLNFTCDKKDAGAVLIRALEPLEPLDDSCNICNGPGKLCKILGINIKLNGTNINDKIKIYGSGKKFKIAKAKRVGISKDKDLLLRFYIQGNKFVSK